MLLRKTRRMDGAERSEAKLAGAKSGVNKLAEVALQV
jgi:hypothetical protein